MSTVSIGSNKKYAENWDAIFKKGKAKKKSATGRAKSPTKGKKAAPAKKKAKAAKRRK